MYDELYVEAHLADLRREAEARKLPGTWRALNARDRAVEGRMPAGSRQASQPRHPVRAED